MACMVTYLTSQVCHPFDGGLGCVIPVIDALLHTFSDDGDPGLLSYSCVLTAVALTSSQHSFSMSRAFQRIVEG